MKDYDILTGAYKHTVTMTAVRMSNDINGNPRYKVQIWSHNSSSIWCPTIKGFRRSKDDTYVLKSVYNLEESMDEFIKTFEESLKNE